MPACKGLFFVRVLFLGKLGMVKLSQHLANIVNPPTA